MRRATRCPWLPPHPPAFPVSALFSCFWRSSVCEEAAIRGCVSTPRYESGEDGKKKRATRAGRRRTQESKSYLVYYCTLKRKFPHFLSIVSNELCYRELKQGVSAFREQEKTRAQTYCWETRRKKTNKSVSESNAGRLHTLMDVRGESAVKQNVNTMDGFSMRCACSCKRRRPT